MASSVFLAAAITTTFAIVVASAPLPILPLETPTISNPPLSPYPELPPDIAPLLPSAGGAAHPPVGSLMPTIPSSRSPPNPDIIGSAGLNTAFAPAGSLQESSAVPHISVRGYRVHVFLKFLAFWLVLVFIV